MPQWVAWGYGTRYGPKPQKRPISPRSGRVADPHDTRNQVGFDDAVAYCCDRELDGIGFVFRADDPFAGLDLDGVRDPESGVLDPIARDLLAELRTYSEVSPSGTGVKAIGRGRLDATGPKKVGGVELYDRLRFFALTGRRLAEHPAGIEDCGAALLRIQSRLRRPDAGQRSQDRTRQRGGGFVGPDNLLLARAFGAKNGVRIRRYWFGDRLGKPSPSEALLALAQLLAFWTGPDEDRLAALVAASPLFALVEAEREKWESARGGEAWGVLYVVRKAIDTCRSFFGGRATPPTEALALVVTEDQHRVRSSSGFRPPLSRVSNPIGAALHSVDADPPAATLTTIPARSAKVRDALRRLAGVCHVMAGGRRGGQFRLSIERGAEVFGVSKSTFADWLNRIDRAGVVRRVEWGNSFNGLASAWEWVGASGGTS